MSPSFVAQLVVSGLALGSVYALVALGFTLIFATTRVVNFAQGELVMIGALVGYGVHVTLGWPLGPAILLAGVVAATVGLVGERVAVYPLRHVRSSVAWVISTLGLGMMLRSAATVVWGTVPLPFPGLFGAGRLDVLGVAIVLQEVVTIVTVLGLVLGLEVVYRRSIVGKAMRAVAFDRDTAQLMGINASTVAWLSFAISGALAAVAGVLVSPITNASPEMGAVLGIKGFAAATVGGIGTFGGALVGGLLLGVLEVLASGLLWSGFSDVVAFGVLIGALLLRPSGILGPAQTVRI